MPFISLYGKLICPVALVIILALTGFIGASIISMHIHILPDGRVIVHSHATESSSSGESNGGSHSHTGKEYMLIHSVSRIFDKLIMAVVFLFLIIWVVALIQNIFNISGYSEPFLTYYSNRAPPLSC